MSLLSVIRNHFRPEPDCFGVSESQVIIEESRKARLYMNQQVQLARHDAFQTSMDQQRIRASLLTGDFAVDQILGGFPEPEDDQ